MAPAPMNRSFMPGSSSWLEHPDGRAAEERLDVLERLAKEDPVGLLGHVAQVRGDHRVRELAERVVERQRLLVEDVEAGAGDGPVPQGPDEGRLVDDGAPRGVDEVRGRLHEGE